MDKIVEMKNKSEPVLMKRKNVSRQLAELSKWTALYKKIIPTT